jgi:glycosyltransferase involved in cell wall biosynthesis
MKNNPRLLRITTVPISLQILLKGQLTFFKSQGFDVLAISSAGKEIDSLRAEGIAHKVVLMTRKITPFSDVISLMKLIIAIRNYSPDIVHTHTPKAGLLGMIAAWFCRVPVRMHTVAGLPLMESTGLKRKVLILTERLTYGFATHVYPNSRGLYDFIQQSIPTRTPLKIIGNGSSNGINTDHFKRTPALQQQAQVIRSQAAIHENDIVFSFVGRIVRDKGIGELVNAFKKILRENANSSNSFYLMLIGSFEQELSPISKEDLHFLHTSKNVVLAGFQTDVRPWIMASDIFVFPSYREGFPNVVMQACCLGVACIVTDINGCNEIISANETGLIVSPKNEEALYNAMMILVSDTGKRKLFADRSSAYVLNHFDQQKIWSSLLLEYRSLLNAE